MAMRADELRDATLRDATLKRVAASAKADQAATARFATLLRDWLARGKNGRIDAAALEDFLKHLPPLGQGSICFLTGRFLATHGQADESAKYLERCARNRDTMEWMRVIAISTLRDRGIDLGDVATPDIVRPEIVKQWTARAMAAQ